MTKKFIEEQEEKQYKQQLAELQQKVNPKPPVEERERLRKEYLEKRKEELAEVKGYYDKSI